MYAPYAVLSLFAALVSGYADPEGCSGVCTARDPGLMRRASDGVYFRFSTFNKISSLRSEALQGPWTEVGSVVPEGSSIDKPGRNDLWVCSTICGRWAMFLSITLIPAMHGKMICIEMICISDVKLIGTNPSMLIRFASARHPISGISMGSITCTIPCPPRAPRTRPLAWRRPTRWLTDPGRTMARRALKPRRPTTTMPSMPISSMTAAPFT